MQIKNKLKDKTEIELCLSAQNAKEKAYSPYSKFNVGAAILSINGKIFSGCNVENASYGLTICAERNAIFGAVANGEKHFTKIAITSSDENIITPCGACCQVLAEFNPKIKLILFSSSGKIKITSLEKIFPQPPKLKKLSKK